jgi:excisionase family DNA binding protein
VHRFRHGYRQDTYEARLVTHDPDWLTIREVARRLSVSQWQVRKWIEAGQFDEIVVFSKRLTRISHGAYLRFVEKYPRRVA